MENFLEGRVSLRIDLHILFTWYVLESFDSEAHPMIRHVLTFNSKAHCPDQWSPKGIVGLELRWKYDAKQFPAK